MDGFYRLIPSSVLFGLLAVTAGCQGDLTSIFGFFGPTVTLIVENDTAFDAVPDFRHGPGRNFVEDVYQDEQKITRLGTNGTIGPRQTVQVSLRCNSDLEQIRIAGVSFRSDGVGVGDIDVDENLRRDLDFDCSDTVRVKLTGSLFFFRAAVNVEQGADSSSSDDSQDDGTNNIGDVLDDLFD